MYTRAAGSKTLIYLRVSTAMRYSPVTPMAIAIGLEISESEFAEWNRAAQLRRLQLDSWLRAIVNNEIARRAATPGKPVPPRVASFARLKDDYNPLRDCEYCGWPIAGDSSARRRYCSDKCRVYAFRARRRKAATT
jgi:predicted nucleic acid-binding Zn ribbon protein